MARRVAGQRICRRAVVVSSIPPLYECTPEGRCQVSSSQFSPPHLYTGRYITNQQNDKQCTIQISTGTV